MSSPLTSRTPLKVALVISAILVGGLALALLINEDLRRYTIAQMEEVMNEDGETEQRVTIEKPEPNEAQVREIARNQERKKREELKERSKELRATVYEIESVVEAKKQLKEVPETEWEKIADQSGELAQPTRRFAETLRDDETPENLKTTQAEAERIAEFAKTYDALIDQLSHQQATEEEVDRAVQTAFNLMREAKGFQNEFNKKAKETPPDEEQAAQSLQESLKALTSRAEENFKEMAKFAKTSYATGERPRKTDQNSPAEKLADASEKSLEEGPLSPLGHPLPSDQELEKASTAELYEQIQEMTQMVDKAFAEGQATDLAQRKDLSMQQARDEVFKPQADTGPDLTEALNHNQPSDRESFQAFNEALEKASTAAEQMARTARNRQAALSGDTAPSPRKSSSENSKALQDDLKQRNEIEAKMTLLARNNGPEDGNVQDMRMLMAENYSMAEVPTQTGAEDLGLGTPISPAYQSAMKHSALPKQATLNTKQTLAQAVPGRRLDMNSERQGWIFLDTWYVIGPWERPKDGEPFAVEFPPEALIDLDATYTGKKNLRSNKPIELKWRFVQTENIRVNPPDEIHEAVYYGYTEVFCASAMEATIAIASDDMAKLWVNGLVVFEDEGLSRWSLDEGFRTILLKPGYNQILIRVENGPRDCFFSVLMCPTEALKDASP
tara:strand:+ start:16584 stop:18602 length:2019 start_codon:yes stop_codon:yes gene_type:complete